jgi:hypothetical protein
MLNNENIQIVISKTNTDGIGNVLKAFITALSIHDNVVLQCNTEAIYGQYDTIMDEKYIFSEKCSKKIEYVYTCRLLVLKSEEEFQENLQNEFQYSDGCQNHNFNNLFSVSKLIDWNYDPNKLYKQLKERILNIIDKITFKDVIIDELKNMENLMINSENNNLAISVRTWKSHHEKNIVRPYSFDIYKNQIITDLENNKIENILLSIDNEEYLQDYINLFENYKNITIFVLKKPDHLNYTQFALIKVLILSKCNFLIANRISTFSELIFWFGKCKIKVFPLF